MTFITTGIAFFAECLRHSAKPLPIVTLGKAFADCNTRQRTLGKYFIGKGFFAEYFFSDTRQRLCRVSKNTRQRKTLGNLRIKKIKKNSKTFFKILGTTLQPYLLPYPLPYHFHYYFESTL
jgi:hypothetical protein